MVKISFCDEEKRMLIQTLDIERRDVFCKKCRELDINPETVKDLELESIIMTNEYEISDSTIILSNQFRSKNKNCYQCNYDFVYIISRFFSVA